MEDTICEGMELPFEVFLAPISEDGAGWDVGSVVEGEDSWLEMVDGLGTVGLLGTRTGWVGGSVTPEWSGD